MNLTHYHKYITKFKIIIKRLIDFVYININNKNTKTDINSSVELFNALWWKNFHSHCWTLKKEQTRNENSSEWS